MSKLIYIFLFFSCFHVPAQPASDHTLPPTGSKQDTGFFVPSSILPDPTMIRDGLYTPGYEGDAIFHPVMAVPAEYRLTIFDRWAQTLFSSKKFYEGWNGYYKDKLCPEGVYFWKIVAISTEGKKSERQGSFYLLTYR